MKTPYKYIDLASTPTFKLVKELLYRMKNEPETYSICPKEFDDLRHEIFEAKS